MHHGRTACKSTFFMGRMVAGLMALSLVGCQLKSDPRSVEYWAKVAQDKQKRSAALQALGQLGKPAAAPILLQYLAEPGDWQGEAAYSLGLLNQREAVPAIVAQMDVSAQSGMPQGAAKVAYNLAAVRALTALHATEATEKFLRLVQNPEPQTRLAAIVATGELRLDAAAPLLMQLTQDHSQPALVLASLRALGEMGAKGAVPVLVKSLYYEPFAKVAATSLLALGPSATPLLIQTVKRQNPDVEARRDVQGHPLPEGILEGNAAWVLCQRRVEAATPAVAAALGRLVAALQSQLGQGKPVSPSLVRTAAHLAFGLGNLEPQLAEKTLLPLLRPLPAKIAGRAGAEGVAAYAQVQAAAAAGLVNLGPNAGRADAVLAAAAQLPTKNGGEGAATAAGATAAKGGVAPTAAAAKKPEAATADSPLLEVAGPLEQPLRGRAALLDVASYLAPAQKQAEFAALASSAGDAPLQELWKQRLDLAVACKEDTACFVAALKEAPLGRRQRAAYSLGYAAGPAPLAELAAQVADAPNPVAYLILRSLQRLAFTNPEHATETAQAALEPSLLRARAARSHDSGDAQVLQELNTLLARLNSSSRG
jgi:HEAT repeat protein